MREGEGRDGDGDCPADLVYSAGVLYAHGTQVFFSVPCKKKRRGTHRARHGAGTPEVSAQVPLSQLCCHTRGSILNPQTHEMLGFPRLLGLQSRSYPVSHRIARRPVVLVLVARCATRCESVSCLGARAKIEIQKSPKYYSSTRPSLTVTSFTSVTSPQAQAQAQAQRHELKSHLTKRNEFEFCIQD